MIHVVQCLIVALIHGIGTMDGKFFGMTLFQEPLFLSFVTGLVLGDVKTGLIMGAQLQLIFMGFVGIGYSSLPNGITGSVLAVAFCIMSKLDPESAIALSMPIALLFQPTKTINRIVDDLLIPGADRAAANGDDFGVARQFWLGTLISFLIAFVPAFVALYFGSDAVAALINVIPQWLMKGITKAGTILPALGIGLLMNYLVEKSTMPFIILGFVLAASLGMNTISIAVLSGVIAVVYYGFMQERKEENEG